MDADCISFLETVFNKNISELFKYIPRGMYKADLWRLCKLYIHGGVYADVDLVPHLAISSELDGSESVSSGATFYSCLSIAEGSIFQAFIKESYSRSPLILGCLVSFLINKAYTYSRNGPTYDMHRFILYNIRHQNGTSASASVIKPDTKYTLRQIKIPVPITANEDIVPLYYFPDDIKYSISISPDTKNAKVLANKDKYRFHIKDNHLFITANDNASIVDMIVDICIDLPEDKHEVIFFFQENVIEPDPTQYISCYIKHQNKNIMDCRDLRYIQKLMCLQFVFRLLGMVQTNLIILMNIPNIKAVVETAHQIILVLKVVVTGLQGQVVVEDNLTK
jgi:hypothetical protein